MNTIISLDGSGHFSISYDEIRTRNKRSNKGQSLLLSSQNFVSIDIETTGLSPDYDEIIELGAAKYIGGQLVDTFDSLVKPHFPINDFISSLTGITNEMLSDAEMLDTVLPQYLSFIGGMLVVGHNVNFDINFIYDECERCGLVSFSNDFVDTMRLSRRMYNTLPNHKLDTVAHYFGLSARSAHRSLNDCEIAANCYLKMTEDSERFTEAVAAFQKKKEQFHVKNIVAAEGLQNPDSPLFNRVCVFTGALEHFTRSEAAQLVTNIGGICEDNITKRTNILVLGNNDYCKSIKDGKSNKQKKAEKLISEGADLIIIPESIFIDMLSLE